VICPRVLSLMIRLSAMPNSSEVSRPSATSGLNGSTAMDLIVVAGPGGTGETGASVHLANG
jgi:hypothetical protein